MKGRGEASKGGHNNSGKNNGKGASKGGFKGCGQEQGPTARDIRQVLKAHTIQIKELGKTRQWWQALQVFRAIQQDGIVPDVIMYNALISALEKGNQPEQALEIFQEMQQHGVVPDVITYSALISALEKG